MDDLFDQFRMKGTEMRFQWESPPRTILLVKKKNAYEATEFTNKVVQALVALLCCL